MSDANVVKQHLVTKANALIEANYRLTLVESKIILYLVSHIRKDDMDFKTYILPIREFWDLMGLKGSPKYTEMRAITKELMGKILEIQEGKKLKQISWVSYVEYNEQEGTVSLSFDPRLKPYLLQLKREFTSYRLKHVMELNSTYSIRMYEILKKWQLIKEVVIPLDQLKMMVGADDKYAEYHNFKKRVLTPAEKEIGAKTDISFSYEEIKSGRRVKALKIIINPKNTVLSHKVLLDFPFSTQLKEKGYTFPDSLLNKWLEMAEEIWAIDAEKELDLLVQDSLANPAVRNHLAFVTYILNQKIDARQAGKDPNIITAESYYKTPIRKEILPKWFTDEHSIEEFVQDEGFEARKKALQQELKERKLSK